MNNLSKKTIIILLLLVNFIGTLPAYSEDLKINDIEQKSEDRKSDRNLNNKTVAAKKHLIEGLSCFAEEQWEKAIASFKKAIAINPYYANAYVNLGAISMRLDKHADAIKYFKKAIKLQPDLATNYVLLGEAYLIFGQFNKSIQSLRKAIEIDNANVEAYQDTGLAYLYLLSEAEVREKPIAADYFYKAGLLAIEKNKREIAMKAYTGLKNTNSPELERRLFKKLYPPENDYNSDFKQYAGLPSYTEPGQSCGIVKRVIDGVTIEIMVSGIVTRVRLLNIDAPEPGAPEGERLKAYTLNVAGGKKVCLRHNNKRGKYGDLLADVYIGGENLADKVKIQIQSDKLRF